MNLKKPEAPTPKSNGSAKAQPTPLPEPKPKPAEKPKEPKPDLTVQREAIKDPKPKSKINNENLEEDEEASEAQEAIKTLNEKRNVVTFFYERLDKVATKIISGLTRVEEHFAGQDIVFINVDTNEVKDIAVTSVPSLVYFKNGEPEPYQGK